MCDTNRLQLDYDVGQLFNAANSPEAEVLPCTHAELLTVGVNNRDDSPRRAQSAGAQRPISSLRQVRYLNAGIRTMSGPINSALETSVSSLMR
jgi:hypothetical protein